VLRYLGGPPLRRRAALFVDRDGVLNERIEDGYVLDVDSFKPLEDSIESLRVAQRSGAAVVVITNQGAVGRGLLGEGALLAIHGALIAHLGARGVHLDGIFACPHHPESSRSEVRRCSCRKPAPGMLLQAAEDLNLDLARSAMIGDQPSDISAALAAGIAPGSAWSLEHTTGPALARAVQQHFASGP